MAAKRYYWLKLKEDFFEDDTIEWIEEQENGTEYALFYLKLCLKSLGTNGILVRNVGDMLIPYDVKKLAEITRTDVDTVRVAMELFKSTGLVQILENGEIYMSQLENMVGSETKYAEQKRLQRAKKNLALQNSASDPEIVFSETLENQCFEAEVDNVQTESKKCPDRDKSIEYRDKSIDKRTSNRLRTSEDKEDSYEEELNIKKINKKKSDTAPTKADLLDMVKDYPPEFQEAFMEWVKVRKIIKKPIASKSTVTRSLSRLSNLTRHINDRDKNIEAQIAILNQSIDNNYQGLFPVREEPEPKQQVKYDFRNT